MAAQYLRIKEDNPEYEKIKQCVDCVKNGGVLVIPTDSVYAFACDLYNKKAVEKIAKLKGTSTANNFSIICADLSDLSSYTRPIENKTFKWIKKALPGPYTFILDANSNVPKLFDSKKRTIGIRIPNHPIPIEISKLLGNPLLTASIRSDDSVLDYISDPNLIYVAFEEKVDIVIDGGYGNLTPTTVVSFLDDQMEIIREGAGEIFE